MEKRGREEHYSQRPHQKRFRFDLSNVLKCFSASQLMPWAMAKPKKFRFDFSHTNPHTNTEPSLATSVSGTSLVFDSVGRGHIGSYLCIARLSSSSSSEPHLMRLISITISLPLFQQWRSSVHQQKSRPESSVPAHDERPKVAASQI